MSGLLEKDFRLLLHRKQGLIMFIVLAFIMSFSTSGAFTIAYCCFFVLVLTIGTISYDEFDNGYSFLMTLPVTPKSYVAEKYVLCGLTGLGGWVFSILLNVILNIAKHNPAFSREEFITAIVMLPALCMILGFMLPIQLKFGAEKSRIVMVAVLGIIGLAAWGIGDAIEAKKIPVDEYLNKLNQISDVQAIAVLIILAVVIITISFMASLYIMQHKDY